MLSDVIGCFILGQGSESTGPQKSTAFFVRLRFQMLLYFMIGIDSIFGVALLTCSLDLFFLFRHGSHD